MDYEYADRGQGPRTNERITLDGNGRPQVLDISGNDFWKSSVRHHLSTASGIAKWENEAERGQAPVGGMYIPLKGTPQDYAVFGNAWRRSPGQNFKLLPAGQQC